MRPSEDQALLKITESIVMIQDNSLKSMSAPWYPKPIVYGTLINCLAFHESTNNPEAYNPADPVTPSYGLLQFKEGTFQDYCVDKYGYSDIWDEQSQRECCDRMLQDDWNNINHWSTSKHCL
jgi:hypothetical protein